PSATEEAPTETSRAVADGLLAQADGYARGEADAIDVVVPGPRNRPRELYRADRQALRRGRDEIDLVEMRWSDISRFPKGLLPFFTSLFGLGLQTMTVGLEASHRADDDDFAGQPGREPPLRWRWIVLVAGVLGALVGLVVSQDATQALAVLAGGATAGAVLLGNVIASRRAAVSVANSLIGAASWWLAAILVPLTVIAAIAATALWLVVDDTFGLNDVLASVLVGAVGALALWRLASGLSNGGWGGRGWRVLIDARTVSAALLAGAIGVGIWSVAATDSIAAGLSRSSLIAAGFGLRAAWLVAVTIVVAALIALLLLVRVHGASALKRLWFTEVATTALSTLFVALVGAILIGGIGAVAYSTATDATWGKAAPEVRCLAEPTSWEWSTDCGKLGAGWGPLAQAIGRDLQDADARQAAVSSARDDVLLEPDPAGRDEALAEVAAEQGEIDLVRDQAAAAEKAAQASPTWWAQDLYSITTRPLAWMVPVLGILLVAGVIAVAVRVVRARRGPRGLVLSEVLRNGPGWRGGLVLLGLGAAAVAWTWAVWTALPDDASEPGFGSAVGAALTSTGVLALIALTRILPVDPRRWRDNVGGGLERLRGVVDRGYDVATYLRLDPTDGDGVRTRIIRRYRAVLRRLEGEYDEIVIVAHSQGTILTIATLFGDARRRYGEAAGSLWGVRPWAEAVGGSALAGRLRGVVTMGSPFLQTYEARLPGQYDWLDPRRRDALAARMRPFSLTWVNAYRARDFIGRAIFQDPLDPANAQEGRGREWRVPAEPEPVRLVDVCLHGAGHHTGYWGDRELIAWLHALLRAPELRDPRGYVIEDATSAL
ncbi:MAG: hypothetical protein ACAH79_12350, partial [Thermoleophilia bacterium]